MLVVNDIHVVGLRVNWVVHFPAKHASSACRQHRCSTSTEPYVACADAANRNINV